MTKIYVKNDFDIFVPCECFMEPLVTGNKNVKIVFRIDLRQTKTKIY